MNEEAVNIIEQTAAKLLPYRVFIRLHLLPLICQLDVVVLTYLDLLVLEGLGRLQILVLQDLLVRLDDDVQEHVVVFGLLGLLEVVHHLQL